MNEKTRHLNIRIGSEKNFGIVFAIIFAVISIWPFGGDTFVHPWIFGFAVLLLTLALLRPRWLALPNRLWFRFGLALGALIAPLIMVLVYFLTVVPIGLIMRLLGKDILGRRFLKNAPTYWIERREPIGSMKNQY